MRWMCPACGESETIEVERFVDDTGDAKVRITCTVIVHDPPAVHVINDPDTPPRRRRRGTIEQSPKRPKLGVAKGVRIPNDAIPGLPKDLNARQDEAPVEWLRAWACRRAPGKGQPLLVPMSFEAWPAMPSPFDVAAGLLAWLALRDQGPASLPSLQTTHRDHRQYWSDLENLGRLMIQPIASLAAASRSEHGSLSSLVESAEHEHYLGVFVNKEIEMICSRIRRTVGLAFKIKTDGAYESSVGAWIGHTEARPQKPYRGGHYQGAPSAFHN